MINSRSSKFPNVGIVFVQLGDNPADQLLLMAAACKVKLPNSLIILITNKPNKWFNFPGTIIEYAHLQKSDAVSKFLRNNREYKELAGGYWLYTLERIFILPLAYELIDPNIPLLHFESDVLSLINETDLKILLEFCPKTSVPRFSQSRGIASVFFSPNKNELDKTNKDLKNILMSSNPPDNDMELLGIALNSGIMGELPTLPKDAWTNSSGEKLVFDGAAYGQYLFGQDPFHTDGFIVSGYKNPDFNLNFDETTWNIDNDDFTLEQKLKFNYKDSSYRILNLHLHSKEIVGLPNIDDARWQRTILEANLKIERTKNLSMVAPIHNQPIGLLDRVRIAKKRGLLRSLIRYSKRRLKLPC
jgi:hypothetical protein